MTFQYRFRLRRGTAAQWEQVNPVLGDGEEGYEKDTRKRKVGNGTDHWLALPYESSASAPEDSAGTTIGTSSMLGANIILSFESVWGISASGDAYYDPDGAPPGEAAVLMLNPHDGSIVIVRPQGASA